MTDFAPPPAIHATAVRPAYETLPLPVRRRIERELGGAPVSVELAGGGFTIGFAARLRAGSGAELFAKAAGPDTPIVRSMYRDEGRHHAALPPEVPAPALRFTDEVGEWTVLGYEAVRGGPVSLPMGPDTARRMLDTWAEAAAALDPPPASLVALDLPPRNADGYKAFQAVASGEEPPFALPPPLRGRIDELAELESRVDAAIASGQVSHSDLRPDNMILGEDRVWICDWNYPSYMAQWVDTVFLLLSFHADGHDADGLLRSHPTARDAADEEVDAVLASFAGGLLRGWPDRPDGMVSPAVDEQMLWTGLAAANWLANRRRWRPLYGTSLPFIETGRIVSCAWHPRRRSTSTATTSRSCGPTPGARRRTRRRTCCRTSSRTTWSSTSAAARAPSPPTSPRSPTTATSPAWTTRRTSCPRPRPRPPGAG